MRLYEIALPAYTNDLLPYDAALLEWEAYALEKAGGFTRLPQAVGVWKDGDDGKTYVDRMVPYRVACPEDVFETLVTRAFTLFPDQVAIFTADIGQPNIVYRET